ncbi:MAG: hypothetical protein J7647_15685 [Cyanobacteria bacterium SBLK]|nr:hypothetical protein [Cyanobacteria bacterium SBLK]
MTKFWLATKSTTATLCLLGIGANAALGIEALLESDLHDLDECENFDTLALDSLFSDADSLNCDASMLEEAETFESNDPVAFEEFADPSWQEENPPLETVELLPIETEAEWDDVPDAAAENWDAPESTEVVVTEKEIVPDLSSEEWDVPAQTEAVETEWDDVPDAAAENWDAPATMAATETEWDTLPDTSLEEWETPAQTEVVETEWDDVPDAAAENWDAPATTIAQNRIEWDNVRDLSETEAVQPAIATVKHGEKLEDDPQFQAVLEPEAVKEEVAKLAPEDLIRDDRQISELIAPTPEQQRAKTTGLSPKEVISTAEDNSLPEIVTDESVTRTPLLDRLDADLRRLRNQAEIVTSQSLNGPTFAPQPIAFETHTLDFNHDALGTVAWQQSEWWREGQLAGQFNLDDELSLENELDIEAIAYSIDPQLFKRDLSELGLDIFDTKLFAGDAIASLFLANRSFESFSLEMDFDSVLTGWENPLADADLMALTGNSTSFAGEIPDLSEQGEDIFAIESEFEALPDLNFGNHPFEFGFQRDFLRASLSSPSKKSI